MEELSEKVALIFFLHFFIVIKYTKHNIYHFSHFQVYSSVGVLHSTFHLLCRHPHHPSLGLFPSSQAETLCLLNTAFLPVALAGVPGSHRSTFHPCELWKYCRDLAEVESDSIDWLLSLRVMSSMFIHVVAYVRISSLLKTT